MSNRSAVPFDIPRKPFAPAEVPAHFPTARREKVILASAPENTWTTPKKEVPVDELSFCHLKTAAEIARISHLREEIQLPASVVADPGFRAREKKEIRKASSAPSNAAAHWLGRFVSFQWIGGLRLVKKFSSGSRSCPPICMRAAGKWGGLCSPPNTAAARRP